MSPARSPRGSGGGCGKTSPRLCGVLPRSRGLGGYGGVISDAETAGGTTTGIVAAIAASSAAGAATDATAGVGATAAKRADVELQREAGKSNGGGSGSREKGVMPYRKKGRPRKATGLAGESLLTKYLLIRLRKNSRDSGTSLAFEMSETSTTLRKTTRRVNSEWEMDPVVGIREISPGSRFLG